MYCPRKSIVPVDVTLTQYMRICTRRQQVQETHTWGGVVVCSSSGSLDVLDAVTSGDAAENKMQITLTYLLHSVRPFTEWWVTSDCFIVSSSVTYKTNLLRQNNEVSQRSYVTDSKDELRFS